MGAAAGNRVVFRSPAAGARVRRSVDLVVAQGRRSEVLLLGASGEDAAHVARTASRETGRSFGWYRFTLMRLAGALASQELGARGLTPAGPLSLAAICARIVHRLAPAGLGR